MHNMVKLLIDLGHVYFPLCITSSHFECIFTRTFCHPQNSTAVQLTWQCFKTLAPCQKKVLEKYKETKTKKERNHKTEVKYIMGPEA